jgi:glyceraldehyde 3-phosphate dehydrogenase
MKIAINGFGRIGRSVFRILNQRDDMEIVAINDLFDHHALAYLLKYDTIMGRFGESVNIVEDELITGNNTVKMLKVRDPKDLPWKAMGVDVVVEATGIFRTKESLTSHLNAGASKVILTVPAKDQIDFTVVLGVNDHNLRPEHQIISNASCTTHLELPRD